MPQWSYIYCTLTPHLFLIFYCRVVSYKLPQKTWRNARHPLNPNSCTVAAVLIRTTFQLGQLNRWAVYSHGKNSRLISTRHEHRICLNALTLTLTMHFAHWKNIDSSSIFNIVSINAIHALIRHHIKIDTIWNQTDSVSCQQKKFAILFCTFWLWESDEM